MSLKRDIIFEGTIEKLSENTSNFNFEIISKE